MNMPTHIVAVSGIVEDERGDILLVRTKDNGWVYPGGEVEVGENLTDALIREVKVESEIDVKVSELIGVYSNTGIHKWYDGVTDVPTKVMFDFKCSPVGGTLGVSDETTDSKWVSKDKVLEMIDAPAVRARFEAFLNYVGETNYMEYVTSPSFDVKQSRKI